MESAVCSTDRYSATNSFAISSVFTVPFFSLHYSRQPGDDRDPGGRTEKAMPATGGDGLILCYIRVQGDTTAGDDYLAQAMVA